MPVAVLTPTPKVSLISPSVMILVAANLVPLYGVVFLGWQVFPLMALFWLENVIIGFFTVLKMIVAKPRQAAGCLDKPFLMGFFCVHYGAFAGGHALFVLKLFGGLGDKGMDEASVRQALGSLQIGWAVLALALSHAASFVLNFLGKREYTAGSAEAFMFQPYGRVVILHLTLLFGGWAVVSFDSPAFALVLLILLKIALDVTAHVREHARFGVVDGRPAAIGPVG